MTDAPESPLNSARSKPKWRLTWKEGGVIFGIIVVLAFLVPAIRQSIEVARRTSCKTNLRQISNALHQYHEKYGSFPPAYTIGATGERLHSWRSLILPYLGERELYGKIRWDEPWNSPHNRALSERSLKFYTCPSAANATKGPTNYFAIVDRATVWPEHYAAKISDMHDGTVTTIQVVEAVIPQASWMEPRDLSRAEAMAWIQSQPGTIPPHSSGTKADGANAAMADGAVRFISSTIDPKILRALTSINGGAAYPGVDWPDSTEVAEHEFPDPRSAADLKQTDVWPVVDREIVEHRNVLYCSTFQMAWDQARKSAGGMPIGMEGNPPLAMQLNAQSFPPNDLAAHSYVAYAGRGKTVVPLIHQELKEKFPNFRSTLLNGAEERVFVAYGFLKKDLPFSVSFDRLMKPLSFHKSLVASFGVINIDGHDGRHDQLRSQVKVLDYVSDDDFILKLIPRGDRDEILLAKIPREKSLGESIAAVRKRVANPDPQHARFSLKAGETLIVPVLSTNIERKFDELIGRSFTSGAFSGLYCSDARQIIRFYLDENGAKLESESTIIGENGHDNPPNPRKLIFDKSFLIWLRETQATEPYFAAWIENAELMQAFERSENQHN